MIREVVPDEMTKHRSLLLGFHQRHLRIMALYLLRPLTLDSGRTLLTCSLLHSENMFRLPASFAGIQLRVEVAISTPKEHEERNRHL